MNATPKEATYADYYIVEEHRSRMRFGYDDEDAESPPQWSSPSSVSPGIEIRFHHSQEATAIEYARNLMQHNGNHTRVVACGETFRRVVAEFMPEVEAEEEEGEEE